MAELDAEVALTMEESFISEDAGEIIVSTDVFRVISENTSEGENTVKREIESRVIEKIVLGSEKNPANEILGSNLFMDDVDRLDQSFFSGVLGALPEEATDTEAISEVEVSERVSDMKINMKLDSINGVLKGREKEGISHLKAEVGVLKEQPLVTNTKSDGEKLGEEANDSEINSGLEINTNLETIDGVLEGSTSAAEIGAGPSYKDSLAVSSNGDRDDDQGAGAVMEEPLLTNTMTDGEKLEVIGDVPAGDKVEVVEDNAFENHELEIENAPCISNKDTMNAEENTISVINNEIVGTASEIPVTENASYFSKEDIVNAEEHKVSVINNKIADNVGEILVNEVESTSSGFCKKDENMVIGNEVFEEYDQVIEANSNPSQDHGADLVEDTAMEVDEVLNYENKVVRENDICVNSLTENQELVVDEIKESSFADETQVVAISDEVIEENEKEITTSEIKSETNSDNHFQKNEDQSKTIMELEEVLNYEEKVAGENDICVNSLSENQELVVDEIKESSFNDETQVMALSEEFPLPEAESEGTKGNENEISISETKSEANDENYFQKNEEQSKTAIIENDNAEKAGVNVPSDSSVIDSQDILQVPTDNNSPESISVSEKNIEPNTGILGETSVDSSPGEHKTANLGSESISNSIVPSEIEPQNFQTLTEIEAQNLEALIEIEPENLDALTETQTLEALMVQSDQPLSTHVSPSVGPSENEPENSENFMVSNDPPLATHVSDGVSSDEVVVTDEIMVLNNCTHGSLVVDLDICMGKNNELVKEDIPLEEVESHVMTDAEFSEYFDGSDNANGEICLEAEVPEKYNAEVPENNNAEVPENNNAEVQEKYIAEELDIEMSERITEPETGNDIEIKLSEEISIRPRVKVDLANHLLPEENESDYSVSDLVWGKVKSHPWWPGQIYDPEDASEKAKQYLKKDSFLVAYFGDRTFAWNEASVLKPFWLNFSDIDKQSNSEVVQNAINSALDEVSRRIMLGLSCSCIPNDIYSKFEYQIVENTGIRQESGKRYGLDESTGANLFKPNKLVEYMRKLAETPSAGTDRLGLVIAKAQLLAFNQMRGYYYLSEFQYFGEPLESDDADNSVFGQENECTPPDEISKKMKSESEKIISNKRKHNLKDGSYSSKREKRLSELMGDGGSMEQDKSISVYAAKVSSTLTPIEKKPSFKVGDCIRRAASQLTGSLSILKNNENTQKVNGKVDMQTPEKSEISPVENSSLDEILLQLRMLARNPVKGHIFGNSVTKFISGFRDSINLGQFAGRQNSATGKSGGGRKRKGSNALVGSPEEFEFDDVSDSYWTDMIIQNNSEEQPNSVLKRGHYELVTLDSGKKSNKSSQRGNSRKRYSTANNNLEMAVNEQMGYIDQMRQANLPAEIILNFPEVYSVPSEIYLNKTFRRFGPLKEMETEIDLETSRARVVFKRCSDAEVAYNSAGKFSIFGPVFVNYLLNYSPSSSFNNFPLATSEGMEDAL